MRWRPVQEKPRYDLIPGDALEEVAKALTHGAAKHEARGWETSPRRWGGEFAAAMRHLWTFARGEHTDPDSGLSHLAHAAARILILLAYRKRGIGEDDMS